METETIEEMVSAGRGSWQRRLKSIRAAERVIRGTRETKGDGAAAEQAVQAEGGDDGKRAG